MPIAAFQWWLGNVLGRRDSSIQLLNRITAGDLSLPARIQGRDPATDLAVLKVDSDRALTVIRTGSSADLAVIISGPDLGQLRQLANHIAQAAPS